LLNCDSYLIDERTLAVKKILTGDYQSKIITTHGIYFSKLSPTNLLDKACLNYLSTKKGRKRATTNWLNYSQKPPFIIEPNKTGVFQTESSKNPDCVWIFNQRLTVDEVAKKESVITFMNGTTIKVKVSKNTILKQKQRLDSLLSIGFLMDRERELYLGGDDSNGENSCTCE